MTAVTLAAAGLSLIFANVIIGRFAPRWDVSTAGNQGLGARTTRVLDSLRGMPTRVVVAADLSRVDARVRRDVADALGEMARRSPDFSASLIDTASPTGLEEYRALLVELAQREASAAARPGARDAEIVTAAIARARELAGVLAGEVSAGLMGIKAATGLEDATAAARARDYLDAAAAGARVNARGLEAAADAASRAMAGEIQGVPVPDAGGAARSLVEALAAAGAELSAVEVELRRLARGEVRVVREAVARARDQAAELAQSLRGVQPSDLVRVAEALRRGEAAIVVGPPGTPLTALDVASLLPAVIDPSGDHRRRAEELIASGLALAADPARPIVVVTHAEPRRFEDLRGIAVFDALRRRLGGRGIDLVEWPVLFEERSARLAEVDAAGRRPVVFVAVSPDSSAQGQSPQGPGDRGGSADPANPATLPGTQRAQRLASVLSGLMDDGAALLINLNPSIFPSFSQGDPIAGVLGAVGLRADSGRPIVGERWGPRGRSVASEAVVMAGVGAGVGAGAAAMSGASAGSPGSGAAIASAVLGLPTYLPWPVAIERIEGGPAEVGVLALLPTAQGIWGESQWLRLWQTPAEQRAVMPDMPTLDAGRDRAEPPPWGESASWVVAAWAERARPEGDGTVASGPAGASGTQRVVVVGSNGWFVDAVTQAAQEVDGRAVPRHPGNMELFEASVLWLAGRESLLPTAPDAGVVALVRPMDPETLRWIRLGVIVGIPLVILGLGLAIRVLRG